SPWQMAPADKYAACCLIASLTIPERLGILEADLRPARQASPGFVRRSPLRLIPFEARPPTIRSSPALPLEVIYEVVLFVGSVAPRGGYGIVLHQRTRSAVQ